MMYITISNQQLSHCNFDSMQSDWGCLKTKCVRNMTMSSILSSIGQLQLYHGFWCQYEKHSEIELVNIGKSIQYVTQTRQKCSLQNQKSQYRKMHIYFKNSRKVLGLWTLQLHNKCKNNISQDEKVQTNFQLTEEEKKLNKMFK